MKGDKIFLQATSTHIQYRYYDYGTEEYTEWENLAALDDLIPNNSVTDAKIGNRTIESPFSGSGTYTGLLTTLLNVITISVKALWDAVTPHIAALDNPHETTKAQVGLSGVDNTSDADKPISTLQQAEFDNKVDKITGKGLSTEDYTSTEKTKLAGIADNANNYTHPSTHPPSIIVQDEDNRFVSDAEKALYSGKAEPSDNSFVFGDKRFTGGVFLNYDGDYIYSGDAAGDYYMYSNGDEIFITVVLFGRTVDEKVFNLFSNVVSMVITYFFTKAKKDGGSNDNT